MLIRLPEAVAALFRDAASEGLVVARENRLPFGAGGVGLLARWVEGALVFTDDEAGVSLSAAARLALVSGLRSAIRYDRLAPVLRRVEAGESAT